eukprot:scaffold3043_cov180-Amphora_coffeaeformis.AAC.7
MKKCAGNEKQHENESLIIKAPAIHQRKKEAKAAECSYVPTEQSFCKAAHGRKRRQQGKKRKCVATAVLRSRIEKKLTPHHVAEKSITTNFCSLEAFKTAASTSSRVPGSATAPPRSKAGKRLDTPKTEGMKGLAEALETQEPEDDEQVLVGACTGTVAVALDVINITQTLKTTRGIPERKRVNEGMFCLLFVFFRCWNKNKCLEKEGEELIRY